MTNQSEKELLLLVQQSDTAALTQLFHQYWKPLYQLALRKTGEPDEAEDLVQELFIDLWKKKTPVVLTTTLQTYLISCLYFKLLKHFRNKGMREKHYQHFSQFFQQQEQLKAHARSGTETEAIYAGLEQVIAETIQLMPPQMQKIFVLRHLGNLTGPQVASQLNISAETVKSQLKAAMQRLRNAASQHPDGPAVLTVVLLLTDCSY